MPIDLFEKYLRDQEAVSAMNGLMVAQMFCARRMMDAFDGRKTATEILSLVMGDIADTMERLKHEHNDTDTNSDRG